MISISKKIKFAYRICRFVSVPITVLGYVPSIILSVWAIRAALGYNETALFLSLLVGSLLISMGGDRVSDDWCLDGKDDWCLDGGYAKEYFKYW